MTAASKKNFCDHFRTPGYIQPKVESSRFCLKTLLYTLTFSKFFSARSLARLARDKVGITTLVRVVFIEAKIVSNVPKLLIKIRLSCGTCKTKILYQVLKYRTKTSRE